MFTDITCVLRLCFQYWKTAMKIANRNFYPIDRTLSLHVPWEFEGIEAEDEILVTHAGGYQHIQAFLQGKSLGYCLENGGLGIQVNPTMATHAKCLIYAKRSGPSDCLDTPAILIGTIKSKYLHRANNTYEAGLRSEHLEHLQNTRVIKLSHLWLGPKKVIEQSIRMIGIDIGSTCFGIEYRLQNLSRLMNQNSENNEKLWRQTYQSHYEEVKAMLDQSTLERLTAFTL